MLYSFVVADGTTCDQMISQSDVSGVWYFLRIINQMFLTVTFTQVWKMEHGLKPVSFIASLRDLTVINVNQKTVTHWIFDTSRLKYWEIKLWLISCPCVKIDFCLQFQYFWIQTFCVGMNLRFKFQSSWPSSGLSWKLRSSFVWEVLHRKSFQRACVMYVTNHGRIAVILKSAVFTV